MITKRWEGRCIPSRLMPTQSRACDGRGRECFHAQDLASILPGTVVKAEWKTEMSTRRSFGALILDPNIRHTRDYTSIGRRGRAPDCKRAFTVANRARYWRMDAPDGRITWYQRILLCHRAVVFRTVNQVVRCCGVSGDSRVC